MNTRQISLCVLFSLFLLSFFSFSRAASITTSLNEDDSQSFSEAEVIYEISASSISSGYTLDLQEKDVLKMPILEQRYYLIVHKITNDSLFLINLKDESMLLHLGESKIIEFTNSNTGEKELIALRLDSILETRVRLHIQNFDEEIVNADYKELFDIEVGLSKKVIYDPKQLTAYLRFVNFGEGPSKIWITYSIRDAAGKEYYKAVDNKIVYTEDSLIKEFDFLKLPAGDYSLHAQIDYGKNQTASSENDFKVIRKPWYLEFVPFFIVLIVIAGVQALIHFRIRKSASS